MQKCLQNKWFFTNNTDEVSQDLSCRIFFLSYLSGRVNGVNNSHAEDFDKVAPSAAAFVF